MRKFLAIIMAALFCCAANAQTAAPSDVQQIRALLSSMFDKPHAKVLADPIVVSGQHAIAGWTAKSDAQNRPLRADLVIDGSTGAILARENFSDRHPLDRIVGIGIAAHEGQLFGWPNQLLNVLIAAGLVLMSASAVTLWLRRRKPGALGAPLGSRASKSFSAGMGAVIVLLGIYLPLFAFSLLAVVLTERYVLRRIHLVSEWLGLRA